MRKRNLAKAASYVITAALVLSNVGGVANVQAATKTKAEVIEITTDNVPVAMGKNVTLKAEVSPEKASKSIVWESANPKYVTVSKNGTITGKAAGLGKFVKIYAKSADGSNLVTYSTVYVTKPTTSLKTSKTSLTVDEGKKATIKTTVAPTKGSSKKLSFVSSNTKVASVNQKGQVTGKKAGTSYITVKTIDGTKLSKKVKVTVKKNAEVNKTITSSDIKDGSYTLDGGTYDNITIDKNVGTANITLKDVKVKNILNLTKGSGYSVKALGSTIAKLKTVETKSVAALAESTNPSFTAGKGTTVSEMTVTGDMNIVEEDGGAIKEVVVSPSASAKVNVNLEGFTGALNVNQATGAETTIGASSCAMTEANLAGKVSIKDTSATGAAKSTIKRMTATEKSTQLDIGDGITVDTAVIKGDDSTLKGAGTIKEATVSGNNVAVDTKGTKVTAEPGTTGVTAGGSKVEAGSSVQTPGGDTSSGGGGGSVTKDFVQVTPTIVGSNSIYSFADSTTDIQATFTLSDGTTKVKVEESMKELFRVFGGTYPENLKTAVDTKWNGLKLDDETQLLGYTITYNGPKTADTKKFTVAKGSGAASGLGEFVGQYEVTKTGDIYTVDGMDSLKVRFVITVDDNKGIEIVGGRTTPGSIEHTIKFNKNNNMFELTVDNNLADRLAISVK